MCQSTGGRSRGTSLQETKKAVCSSLGGTCSQARGKQAPDVLISAFGRRLNAFSENPLERDSESSRLLLILTIVENSRTKQRCSRRSNRGDCSVLYEAQNSVHCPSIELKILEESLNRTMMTVNAVGT